MSVLVGNPFFLGAGASAGAAYQIKRSLRFNSSDSAYLSRTPSSAGNRKTWTWAGWVKNTCSTATTIPVTLLSARNGAGAGIGEFFWLAINNIFTADGHQIAAGDGNVNYLVSTASFRDPSAWYHIVCAYDSTQATADNRLRLYVNGTEITVFNTNNRASLTQNSDGVINRTSIEHRMGLRVSEYSNCYLADIHFIDGQALTPSSFGQFDANDEWQPKAYTGSYGTNGFRLDFSDNSAATATALGKDRAGSNNWTPNNLSVTAGAGNDSLVDTPTSYGTDTGVGGEVRGNYATFNPVAAGLGTLSNGNLDVAAAGGHGTRNATIGVSSGKWYSEFNLPTAAVCGLGITSSNTAYATWPDNTAGNYWFYFDGGTKYFYPGGGTQATSIGAPATGIWKIALDLDSGKCWLGTGSIWYDSAWNQTGNPATGANPTFSSLPAATYFMFAETQIGTSWQANFGQRPWGQTCPSGFKALCDTNLPAPTIARPSTVMDVRLYTGTGSSLTPTSTLGFNPDLIWIKSRSAATDHALYDAVRGAQARLESNTTDAEVTSDGGVTAFNSAGFTVGTLAQVNTSSATYAAWAWDAGSSTVTNTQGSITSSVRANASAGFSIVTFTFNSTGTVGHGLGVAPEFVIVKARGLSTQWFVYHKALGASKYIRLSFTGEAVTFANAWTPVNSTVFQMEAGLHSTGSTYVAYCFAPVAGYSAFGSYTGNGSADGPFVYTGFRPRWVMIKNSTSDGGGNSSWLLVDTARGDYNVVNPFLLANTSAAEGSVGYLDILSNGFKLRATGDRVNASATYIYAAFAENPFQYARAR